MSIKENRFFSFAVIFFVYCSACAVGMAVFMFCAKMQTSFLIGIAAADIAATIWTFIWSLVFKNSSVYDPYWSFAPWVMLIGTMVYAYIEKGFIAPWAWVLFALLSFWSWRLTGNWAVNFSNLTSQDWRYTLFKNKAPKLWFVTNFFGIHLMPTLVVFFASVPLFYGATFYIDNYESLPLFLGLLPYTALPGALMCISAVLVQIIADAQMLKFRKNPLNNGKVNSSGIWNHVRHPNYLGEILMWWGIYLTSLAVCTMGGSKAMPVWAFAGALANTLLFIFISVPLMEKRQLQRRGDYKDYMKHTGALLPKFSKDSDW